MNLQELANHLKSIGVEVAYSHFDKPTPLPYIVYSFTNTNDLIADNINFVEISNIDIELYSDKKDLALERLLQDKLKELELPHRKYEAYIDKERMYQVVYEIQIL